MANADQRVSGVPGRYASALFELAGEEKAQDRIGTELASLQKALDNSDELRRLVRSPVYSAEDQTAALEAICDKAQISGTTLNFVRLMAKNRRLAGLADTIKGYQTLVAISKGEVEAQVTSAEKLTNKHITALKAALKASTGRDVQLTTRVDKSILGGLIVKVGSRMMDNSLKTKLQNLKIAMKGTA
ncbi:MAG: F0F1 ATP synthase subunit delta [Aestuariivirga sp.]